MKNSIVFKILTFAVFTIITMPYAIRAMIAEMPARDGHSIIMQKRSDIIILINSWENTFQNINYSTAISDYESEFNDESQKLKTLLPNATISINNIGSVRYNPICNKVELVLYKMFESGKLLSGHFELLKTLKIIRNNCSTHKLLLAGIEAYNNNLNNIVQLQNNDPENESDDESDIAPAIEIVQPVVNNIQIEVPNNLPGEPDDQSNNEAILQNSTNSSKIKYLVAAFFGSIGVATAAIIYRKNLATIVASYLSLLTIFTIPIAADTSAITHELLKQ
jgi:hypothetical protein